MSVCGGVGCDDAERVPPEWRHVRRIGSSVACGLARVVLTCSRASNPWHVILLG